MDGLDCVAEVVEQTGEGGEGPVGAAEGFPALTVVGEGPEGDECVVGGAAAEDFCAGVADVRISCVVFKC